jgi:hypothetical protein
MARLTKEQLEHQNRVLSSRCAALSATLRELQMYSGIPPFLRFFISDAVKNDNRFVSDLVSIKTRGY